MNNRELVKGAKHVAELVADDEDAGTMWTFITRHPAHESGRWQCGGPIYETREQARAAAIETWGGTTMRWRLMSIPGPR